MIIHSIVNQETIFGEADSSPNIVELEYKGSLVQALQLPNNQYKIERIISTYPKDYLSNELYPGLLIKHDFS